MEVYSILTLVYKKERMYTELIESLPLYKAMAEKVVEVVSILYRVFLQKSKCLLNECILL